MQHHKKKLYWISAQSDLKNGLVDNTMQSIVRKMVRSGILLTTCTLISLFFNNLAFAAPPQLSADEPIVFDGTTQSLMARGNAEFTHNEFKLQAEEVRYFREQQRAEARGNVIISQEGLRLVSERVDYDVATRRIETGAFRVGVGPVFAEGTKAEGTQDEMEVENVLIYYGEPESGSPNVRAASAIIRPGEEIEIQSLMARVGKMPLLYLPKLSQDFEDSGIKARGEVGYRNNLGGFFRSRTLVPVTRDLNAGANFDVYTDRGVLIGPALSYIKESSDQFVHSEFYSGWIHDDVERGIDVLRNPIDDDRYFAEWRHFQQLAEGVQIRGRLSRWSDSEITRDFRPERYRIDQQPDSFVEATLVQEDFMVSVFARANVNKDFPIVERLPEIRLDKFATELIDGTGLYHSGSASFARLSEDALLLSVNASQPYVLYTGARLPGPGGSGLLIEAFPSSGNNEGGDTPDLPIPPGPPPPFTPLPPPGSSLLFQASETESDFNTINIPSQEHSRFNINYTLQRPTALTKWLSLTPRAGLQYTYYSESSTGAVSVGRLMGEFGADLQALMYGQWDVRNNTWNITGLRHILRPVVQWRYHPNGEKNRLNIEQIDRQIINRSLQPLDLSDIRNTDDLLDTNVLRFGFENVFQTRDSKKNVRELARVDVYQDVVFTSRSAFAGMLPLDDDNFDATYLRLYSQPAHWLDLSVIGRIRTEDLAVDETRLRATIRSGNSWWTAFELDSFEGLYRQYTGWFGFRFADRWRFVASVRYDAEQSLVTEQSFSVFQRLGRSLEVEYRLSLTEGATREDEVSFTVGLDLVRF